jgi:uncharacterized protein YaiI (UPF0178 family)
MRLTEEQEEMLEYMYFEFDARRSGYNQWKQNPQSERDAYKQTFRNFLNKVTNEF